MIVISRLAVMANRRIRDRLDRPLGAVGQASAPGRPVLELPEPGRAERPIEPRRPLRWKSSFMMRAAARPTRNVPTTARPIAMASSSVFTASSASFGASWL